ncbi:hypothetical protein PF006_g14300 [Phytophthora fragariae]|uniref:SUEL-type lectin domain-containing protein n=2 Tax=Phytophthora fragariae TaxID=53985 RepID=A0A6A3TM47_9STRA|nr:hypothetical protein PF006_g14300 [Phytophthora fragariae]
MKSFGRHWATALVLAAMLSSFRPDSSGSTHTAYSLFSDSACTKATYVDFSMDSNDDSNCEDQGCNEAEVGGLFYTYSCVPDYSEFASLSFGESPYLVVQTHTDKSCTADSSVRIYLADGKCHVRNEGYSFTATLNSDGSGVLAKYRDQQCTEDEYKTTLPKDKLTAHGCMGYVAYSAYNHATTTPAATEATPSTATPAATTATTTTPAATTVTPSPASRGHRGRFPVMRLDSTCAEVTYVSFSMDSNYDSNCQASGCNEGEEEGVFYTNSCVPDYSEFASSSFGQSPYLVAQAYSDKSCTTESYILIYLADGKCHVRNEGYSFTATLNSDGSGVLAKYRDQQCREDEYKTTLPKDKLTAHGCMGYVAYSAYNHATTTPAATEATPSTATPAATTATTTTPAATTVTPSPASRGHRGRFPVMRLDSTCAEVTYVSFSMDSNYDSNCQASGCNEGEEEGVFYTNSCVPDYSEFASSSFGQSPYLVAQAYSDKSCTTESYILIYLADGKCHVRNEGYSFTATLNSDGSGVLAKYRDQHSRLHGICRLLCIQPCDHHPRCN